MSTNTCSRCGDEYNPYTVLYRDNFLDVSEYIILKEKYNLHEGDNDGLCKPCRMDVADYGVYLTKSEKEELEPKEEV